MTTGITIKHSPSARTFFEALDIPSIVTAPDVQARIDHIRKRTNWNEVRKPKTAISASMLGKCKKQWWFLMNPETPDISPIVPEWKMDAEAGSIFHEAIQKVAIAQGLVATINGKLASELVLDASVMPPERYALYQSAGISDRTRLDNVLIGKGGKLRQMDWKTWKADYYADIPSIKRWLETGNEQYITGRFGEVTAAKKLKSAVLQDAFYAYGLGLDNGTIAIVRRPDGAVEAFTHDVPEAIIMSELERTHEVTTAIKEGREVEADMCDPFCPVANYCHDKKKLSRNALFSYRDAIPNEPELAIVAIDTMRYVTPPAAQEATA